jgi:broad specificity phosphatase PhoE
MKILEVRRHSVRSPYGNHLSQEGVTLARFVGQAIGPFDRVVTSTLSRAFETAIAMGFAVTEQSELMSTYGHEVDKEAPWPMSFAEYSQAVKHGRAAMKYAKKLAKYYVDILQTIPEGGSVLAINHGGVVEIGVVGCLPEFDFSAWGGPVEYCEGARLFLEKGKFIRCEELRVSM